MKKSLTGIITLMVMVSTGFSSGCYDREVESEVKVDHDTDLNGRTDTTIKREVEID